MYALRNDDVYTPLACSCTEGTSKALCCLKWRKLCEEHFFFVKYFILHCVHLEKYLLFY